MKPSWWLLSVLIAVAYAGSAQAQSTRAVNIGGTGRDPCAVWSEDRNATAEPARQASERQIEWVTGFLSAVNLFNDPSGNLKGGIDDRDGMLVWIDNYCSTHPREPLWAVAADFVLDLRNHPRK